MFWKVIIDNQLFVYHNGTLLYKRWLKLDYGKVFYGGKP
jgi:hypothetical protein